MQPLKQLLTPRRSVFDKARRDTVLDLTDLVEDRIDPAEFFAENHITEGMKTLLTEGFRRLEGKSAQGVYKLTQSMGGGKTHNLIALGLLAKHPDYRQRVMADFYTPAARGPVRVVAFSGRESDARDVMRLLLVASLSTVAGGTKGLTIPEVIAHLCAPERDISRLKGEVINRLIMAAWYLLPTLKDGCSSRTCRTWCYVLP